MPDPFLGHLDGATVAVTGASGNLGTALLRRLTAPGSGVAEVRGLARRQPPDTAPYDGVRWHLADLGSVDSAEVLPGFLDGVDAVVHLAWALQPGRRPDDLRRVNVGGTGRVVRAAAEAGVAHVVHMSSLGAYAPGAVGPAGHRGLADHRDPERAVQPRQGRGRARRPGDRRPAPRPDADRRPAHAGAAARGRQRDRPLLPRAAAVRGGPPAARRRGEAAPAAPPGAVGRVRARRRRRRRARPDPGPARGRPVQPRRRAADGRRRRSPARSAPGGCRCPPSRCGRRCRRRSPRT